MWWLVDDCTVELSQTMVPVSFSCTWMWYVVWGWSFFHENRGCGQSIPIGFVRYSVRKSYPWEKWNSANNWAKSVNLWEIILLCDAGHAMLIQVMQKNLRNGKTPRPGRHILNEISHFFLPLSRYIQSMYLIDHPNTTMKFKHVALKISG